MHQCDKNEMKFSMWSKISRQERQEEVSCSVCRVIFCCSQDRERHEDAEHGRENAQRARQQLQHRKEKKPLVCVSCCQVFISGLFVNEPCTKVAQHDGIEAAGKLAHILIIIPEWAVTKYLLPNNRKRSWEQTNEDSATKLEIRVPNNVDNLAVDGIPVQENSFARKTSIQGILTKQRKTELSVKRDRRVTFSPITAVAITSVKSIIKVETRQTRGEPSPDYRTDTTQITPSYPPASTDSTDTPAEKHAQAFYELFCHTLKDTPSKATYSPFEDNGGKEDCVFSPPLPGEGSNGSPMLAPQMSSTPVCLPSSERRNASTQNSPSEYQSASDASGPSEGIFGSLANIICCAFQALPSVLTQFFATVNENEDSGHSKKERSLGRERRRRRRSATFTPYVPLSLKSRRLDRKEIHGQDSSMLPIVRLLQSHPHQN